MSAHCVCSLFPPQPESLTQVLEYSNLFFTVLFAAEMLLKILAEGPFGYIKNGFNVFDGLIVVIRYASLIDVCVMTSHNQLSPTQQSMFQAECTNCCASVQTI